MKAKVLVAGADEDRGFDDAPCARLDKALKGAGVDAEVTISRGAKHSYAPPDIAGLRPRGLRAALAEDGAIRWTLG